MPQLALPSLVGPVTLAEADGAIVSLDWGKPPPEFLSETPLLLEARRQLERYFAGDFAPFDLPLAPAGNQLCQQVWRVMQEIPAGQTLTYGEVATRLGSDARAIGAACGANPIPIIIPCHRILAAGGRLGGYSGQGGVATKTKLLRHEGALLL